MNYIQWTQNQTNLFEALNELTPNSIINILGVESLQMYYDMAYGNRDMLPTLETKSTQQVAKVITSMFLSKWESLAEIYINHFEVGFDSSVTTTSNNKNVSNKQLSTNSTNTISADNVDDFTNVSGEIDNVTEESNVDIDNESNVVTIKFDTLDKQRKILENSNITTTICNDIVSVIGLSIY